ncbi:AMP-binding protein [Paraburkholderia phymatum]|uniref:Long-chain-fatty-acid--CoA ligase n=2 Tax=Paraburkholderia phymatum TaxID=148447 RepID=B2JTV8_PARP8|nr:AMP-dependent synthetase and ligase [Paraburkholderia phymatum STM815]
MFELACARYARRPAFSSFNHAIEYRDVARYVRHFAEFLINEFRLERSERVALILPNGLPYVVTFFGVLDAGLVVANVNPLATPREIQIQLSTAAVSAIVVLENFAYKLDDILDENLAKAVVSVAVGDLLPPRKRAAIHFVQRVFRHSIPPTKRRYWTFSAALSRQYPGARSHAVASLDDVALLQFTGGTTGTPKCAMLTHRNLSYNIAQIRAWLGEAFCSTPQTVLTPLPLCHIFALTASLLTFVELGGHNVLVTDPRDIAGLVRTLRRTRPTALLGVNTLFHALLDAPHFRAIDWSRLRLVIGGGAAIHPSVAERWQTATGMPIIEGYGLTEASPVVCVNPTDAKHFSGSVGYPLPSTEVSIRDDDGAVLAAGSIGEVWVRGPQVMRGYWMNPDETAKAISPDGWLRTGDVGYFTPTQMLVLVDRKKDVIIVSGFKVYPSEVEAVVSALPGVTAAAAVGVPDERTGQAVKLFVAPPSAGLTAAVVLAHCRANLSAYKVPRLVEFRETLPLNELGKVLHRALM